MLNLYKLIDNLYYYTKILSHLNSCNTLSQISASLYQEFIYIVPSISELSVNYTFFLHPPISFVLIASYNNQ